MIRVLAMAALLAFCGAVGGAGGARRRSAQGRPVPHRVVPIEEFSASIKDWNDESLPHYSIITHVGEWELAFQPAQRPGKPFSPDGKVFEKAQMVAISRVSAAPAPGQRVLVVKSLVLEHGELVLTYSFIPPQTSGPKVKNTILVAYPIEFQNGLRFIEDTETEGTMAANMELEEAIRAGRIKTVPPPQAPGQQMPPQQMPQPPQRQMPVPQQPMPR